MPDRYWAEKVFWGATGVSEIPYRGGVEVVNLAWKSVQAGLEAAKTAGTRQDKPVPDWVHANAMWMNKRLEGRGITLVGHVRSKFGKSNFHCSNGHKWRTVPNDVAQGEGCPYCGMGTSGRAEIQQKAKAGVLSVLVHPDHPGLARIEASYGELNQNEPENSLNGWEVHRFRRVEEPALAESLMWALLGQPLPHDRGPIHVSLFSAEDALRHLIYRMHSALASRHQTAIDPSSQVTPSGVVDPG